MTTPPLFFDILILKNRQTFFYMVFILCVLGGGSEQSSLGGEEFTRLEPVLLIVLSRPMGDLSLFYVVLFGIRLSFGDNLVIEQFIFLHPYPSIYSHLYVSALVNFLPKVLL